VKNFEKKITGPQSVKKQMNDLYGILYNCSLNSVKVDSRFVKGRTYNMVKFSFFTLVTVSDCRASLHIRGKPGCDKGSPP
jgi:hypothetical protein